jgi:maltose alpha-D-glucosyltransferase/alpha-amylase
MLIKDLWYKNTVIYNLDLETFMDTNGDGIGDFEGLMRCLDYLDTLGIGAIWLAPFQPTPNRDDGYDVSDYYGVDPRYGSSGDFVEFMHEANERGIRVIIDLVVNHTSDQHPWFQEARKNKHSKFHDWYVWSKKRPADWNRGMVFPGVQKSIWSYDKEAREYYYHRFYEFQPDLNIENEDVRTEIHRILGYWTELGIAGFRLDAVPFIIEDKIAGRSKTKLKFEYLSEMRRFLQWRCGDAILLGEANVLPKENKNYFGADGDAMHMMFNFFVNQHIFYALATAEVGPLIDALRATKKLPETAQWAQFLRNHDELDLGRLTHAQRDKVFARFAPEKNMQLYDRGIRRRLAPMLGDQRQLQLAYSLLFSLPGTPVLRYGDEIGMGDDLSLPERYPIRTPMQWSGDAIAGFSKSAKPVRPVIDKGPYSYHEVNVERQQRDPHSLLNWMTRMIKLRKECPEIGWGDWKVLNTGAPGVLAMCYTWRGNSLVVIHNFGEEPREIRLKIEAEGADRLVNLLENDESRADENGNHRMALEVFGYRWFRVGHLNYSLYQTRT